MWVNGVYHSGLFYRSGEEIDLGDQVIRDESIGFVVGISNNAIVLVNWVLSPMMTLECEQEQPSDLILHKQSLRD